MLNRLCVLLLALSLPGLCFAAKPVELPMPLAEQLQVEVIESQQEIAVVVPATAQAVGMQFGLIGALIGSAVQNSQVKKAEESVVPLRDLLVAYPFNQKMQESLKAKLASEGISLQPVVTVMPTVWEAHDAQQSAQLPPHALVLRPSFNVDNQYQQLNVSVMAQLVDRTVKSNGKIKVVPRFTRMYTYQFPMQGARSEDPLQDWLALGTAGLTQVLDRGIQQATDMLVNDFTAESRAAWNAKVKPQSVGVLGNLYSGVPVREGEGWAWVRQGKGHMQSLLGVEPLQVGTGLASAAAAAPVVADADAPAAVASPVDAPVPAVTDAAAAPAADAAPAPEAAPQPAAVPADVAPAPVATPAGG
jgi:hypothetical protein